MELAWPQGDKTMLQVDHSSISADNNHIEVMSLYRLLVLLETNKKVLEHKVSYTDVSRVNDANSGSVDSFKVTLAERQKYICLKDTVKVVNMKNFFGPGPCMTRVEQSPYVGGVFRWRFERVHGTLKVQKPYVLSLRALDLKAKQPIEVA